MSATHTIAFDIVALLLPLSALAALAIASVFGGFWWLHHDPHCVVFTFISGAALHLDQLLGWIGIIASLAVCVGVIAMTIAAVLHG